MAVDLEVLPLTADRFADLAQLFDEGGDPKWCSCMWFRIRALDWTNTSAAANRAGLRALAERPDLAPGLVGYHDGRAVGWVSLAPREDFDRLEVSRVLARVDATPVWSIVCFVVSKKMRGQGVAAALLEAAIAYARTHGATMLEAYPVASASGRVSAASAYRGGQSMYARAGFRLVATRQANKSTQPRPILRLALE